MLQRQPAVKFFGRFVVGLPVVLCKGHFVAALRAQLVFALEQQAGAAAAGLGVEEVEQAFEHTNRFNSYRNKSPNHCQKVRFFFLGFPDAFLTKLRRSEGSASI